MFSSPQNLHVEANPQSDGIRRESFGDVISFRWGQKSEGHMMGSVPL